jgi:hypothetical protein
MPASTRAVRGAVASRKNAQDLPCADCAERGFSWSMEGPADRDAELARFELGAPRKDEGPARIVRRAGADTKERNPCVGPAAQRLTI